MLDSDREANGALSYRDADDRFFEILKGATPMFATLEVTRFPQTYRAMFGFCAKTNSLKSAMLDLVDAENLYAFKALYRCFCEHYLKFSYIFFRFLKEKTDDVGREYFSYCGAVESLDYLKSIVLAEGLIGNQVVADFDGVLRKVYPEAAALERSALETASARFRYRSILRYINAEVPDVMNANSSFLAAIIPAYAELSSFVHGGPWSDLDMYAHDNPKTIEKCTSDAGLIFMMATGVFLFTAMAVSREFPEHSRLAGQTYALLKDFDIREQ